MITALRLSENILQELGLTLLITVYSIGIPRLIFVLKGNPRENTGVYKTGMEHYVDGSSPLTVGSGSVYELKSICAHTVVSTQLEDS
ncbi:hypothetical protein M422DRAFT_255346 [Sphaerobolus stellatus SS14]|uniref:Uncharacterized protein n=1 Tax=Sphaerobolus stellatus (strain SS14) TaxID=990650 RepID=A0A0C9V480_SPHS4|nr:hypothetical protein M422DRAFT_255346 [Sphaerobolus stellatus SS14]